MVEYLFNLIFKSLNLKILDFVKIFINLFFLQTLIHNYYLNIYLNINYDSLINIFSFYDYYFF